MARLTDDRGAIAEALLARQVATHRAHLTLANVGSAFAGLVLVAMQWGAVPAHALASWFAVLSLVLGLRLLMFSPPRQRRDGVLDHQAQLLRFRLAFFAHGVAWGLASWMPLPSGDAVHLALLVIVLVGITASSFTLTAFDRVSALCFGLPALGQVVLHLLVRGDPAYAMLGVAGAGLLGFLNLTAGRAHRFVRKYVALRVAEAEQAESLRSSEELLDRTGATAGVGGRELDVATRTLRLTADAPDDGAAAEMRAPVGIEAPTHAERSRKVLYIEDNPINVLLMEAMLALVPDLQLVIAPLPELGLQMAVHEHPDLILLDIQLPGMDGYEVLRRLQLDPAVRSIPVIAVSANATESDIQSGLAAGFTRYLTKPLDVRQVLVAVQDTLAAA